MPLTEKGTKILSSMRKTYDSDKKAKSVFYASINAGKIKGAEGRAGGGRTEREAMRSELNRPLKWGLSDVISSRRMDVPQGYLPDYENNYQTDNPDFRYDMRKQSYEEGGHVSPRTGWRGGFQPMRGGGFINSAVPGRTDKHYVTVKSGSYVLPADHVSAVGENNSIAGADVIKRMFGPGTRFGARLTIPKFAAGGGIDSENWPHRERGDDVPIVVAGGEIVLPPSTVKRIGSGDLDKGHSILDKWVMETRKKHVAKLKSLKPPKGS